MATAGGSSIHRTLAIGVFVLALIVVAVLMLTPGAALPKTNIWDKLEHAAALAGLAVLGFLAFPERKWAWWLALGLVAFGSVCETLQMFVPGRDASLEDAIANLTGVLIVSGSWRLAHCAMDWRSAHNSSVKKMMAPHGVRGHRN